MGRCGEEEEEKEEEEDSSSSSSSQLVGWMACAGMWSNRQRAEMTLAGLEPAIFGSEDQRLIH